MSASSFPDDLVPDLFARLPPKSLLRFRCVSKSWRALIDSPELITMHLRQSILCSNGHEYVFRARTGDQFKIYAARFDSARNFNIAVGSLKGPLISERKLSESRLVGSCNGLICMKDTHNQIILWNPWIRKHFTLPYSPPHKYSSNTHGFGYDDNTQDYKVVRLVDFSISGSVVRLYSLKSNSWKKLPRIPYSFTDEFTGGTGVLANCALHWFVDSGGILAFDLRTEDYRIMQMQKAQSQKNNYGWRLGVLDGCLCLFPNLFFFSFNLLDPLLVRMWIMKDYGREDSWTQLVLQVPIPGRFLHMHLITGYSEGNTQLVLQKLQGDVLWYDFTGGKWVEIGKFPGPPHMMEGFNCVGSLVLPYGGQTKGMKRTRGDWKSDVYSSKLRRSRRLNPTDHI